MNKYLKDNNKKIMLFTILVLLIIVSILVFNMYNKKSTNKELLASVDSLIEKQSILEEKIITKGYTIDKPNIILDPYDNSPLSALILFETDKEVEPTVTVMGIDDKSTFTHKFKKSRKHYIEVLGLYPDKENTVMIEYNDIKRQFKIKTDPLPKGFILPTSVKADRDSLDNKLYFMSPSGLNRACAYDINGDVRWYLSKVGLWDNTRLKNGHMIVGTERLLNMPYYITGLYEIDMMGKIYNEYSLPGGYHHDYFELDNGNLLVLSNDFNNKYGTVEDYIVELDRKNGKIVKEWDLKGVIPMDTGKSENWSSYDWFHNNSIWYDKKTDSITLSGRHLDAVINISYKTGKLNWIIGDKTNWDKDYHKYFFKPIGDNFEWQWSQHAAMITPEGYVFILDNGNNKSKIRKEYTPAKDSYTRGVMYKIDTNKMTIEQVYEYGKERGHEFYSPYISDVDYLAKDNYIIHSGGIVYDENGNISNQPAAFTKNPTLVSDTVEVKNGKVIYEITLPTNNYRVEKMDMYSTYNFELGKASDLGTLGRTKVSKHKFGSIDSKDIDEVYTGHKVSFNLEKDRLVFKGQFKREDKVEVILYKNMISNYYEFPITKTPYTAMCVDVFTEEENKNGIMITRYINKTGLNGKYSVYLNINGTIYNTGKYIEF